MYDDGCRGESVWMAYVCVRVSCTRMLVCVMWQSLGCVLSVASFFFIGRSCISIVPPFVLFLSACFTECVRARCASQTYSIPTVLLGFSYMSTKKVLLLLLLLT